MTTETGAKEDERGFARQQCTTCGRRNDSSTIFRHQAKTYDPRCIPCGTGTCEAR